NQPIRNFHDFNEIHLFSVRRFPGVLPGSTVSVGKKPSAVIVPLIRGSSDELGEEWRQFLMSATHPPPAQHMICDSASQRSIGGVTGQQGLDIVVGQGVLPRTGDRFDLASAGLLGISISVHSSRVNQESVDLTCSSSPPR